MEPQASVILMAVSQSNLSISFKAKSILILWEFTCDLLDISWCLGLIIMTLVLFIHIMQVICPIKYSWHYYRGHIAINVPLVTLHISPLCLLVWISLDPLYLQIHSHVLNILYNFISNVLSQSFAQMYNFCFSGLNHLTMHFK